MVDKESDPGFGIEMQKATNEGRKETGAAFRVISDNGITVSGSSFPDINTAIEAAKTAPSIYVPAPPGYSPLFYRS
ncbi:MAG: hypothetical protein JW944_13820 [Deltaproteobacteria bacterium]|nr:hypothetical protein [Deltaproteobacteria bacterium]